MLEQKKIKLLPSTHKGKSVVQIHFEKDEKLKELLRSATFMRWSMTMNCWYLPFYSGIVSDLFNAIKHKYFLDYSALKSNDYYHSETPAVTSSNTRVTSRPGDKLSLLTEQHNKRLEEYKYWLKSKRYSANTIDTYVETLKTFLRFFADKSLTEISNDDLIRFNNEYILANKFSASYQNQFVNAVKLFFSVIEHKNLDPDLIHRPKRMKLLPNVLSKEEVKMILNAHRNIKHKAMLSLIYSCGLRCGELLNLRPTDVDSNRKVLIIRQSKGRKDRIAPLSEKIIVLLRDYYVACRPKVYLFEGQKPGTAYDARSLQNVLKQSLVKVNISKPVSLHWLRHSYATHLLEQGTDLRYIQEILGHSSSKTTEIYTHVSTKNIQKIVSPFDYL